MKQGIFMREMKADAAECIIDIIGVIGWEVWYPAMRDMLRTIPATAKRVIFEIYSPGGDVWEGNAIVQMIGEMKQETLARVQVAASMATSIAVACKQREIASNGRWLIHNPWAALMGDAAAMEKRAVELRACEQECAEFYAARTGQKPEDMLKLMAEERWLTPQETLDLGFVQKINNPFNAADFEAVKAEIMAAGKWPKALIEIPVESELDKPEKKEIKDGNANPTGTANIGVATITLSDAAANGIEAEPEIETPAETAPEVEHSRKLSALAGSVEALRKKHSELVVKHDALEVLQRRTQGERDSARAQAEKASAALNEATEKLEKLLSGGLSFAPCVETWQEALAAAGGNYEKARKQYPEVYREQREKDKINRK